ncbi:hypothetical protein O1W71_16380 [Microbacterium sp. H37-C3]|uniref:hypothetical protein n=1 Tax=Microbacterium sp. H37-C3 TaxID=3004354 RepID=UPI0022B0458A|nr:hypothetical protein [Microbacterium sp. H37-C3]MCZ4069248.1 hypothetical protein [Microbacterium sp. H37-C3]
MRDVMTVPYGEKVTISQYDGHVMIDATFKGIAEHRLIIETGNGIHRINPNNTGRVVVLDLQGRELGFIDPDPILPTTTPDLE